MKKSVSDIMKVVKFAQANPCKKSMDCPCCGERLEYIVADTNKHVHGKCTTDKCISFMMWGVLTIA